MNYPPAPYEVDSLETGIPRELYDCLTNLKRQQLSTEPWSKHAQ